MHGNKEISFSFTQEWPIFSQTQQFSDAIPYTFNESENSGLLPKFASVNSRGVYQRLLKLRR